MNPIPTTDAQSIENYLASSFGGYPYSGQGGPSLRDLQSMQRGGYKGMGLQGISDPTQSVRYGNTTVSNPQTTPLATAPTPIMNKPPTPPKPSPQMPTGIGNGAFERGVGLAGIGRNGGYGYKFMQLE